MTALPPGWDAALGEHAEARFRHGRDASCWRLTLDGSAVLFDAGRDSGPCPTGRICSC